jgi:hypothetical protein
MPILRVTFVFVAIATKDRQRVIEEFFEEAGKVAHKSPKTNYL